MENFRVKPNQLIMFYLVASEESFTGAARRLRFTQSAVNQQVKALEMSTGVNLIKMRGKKVELTEAGKIIFPYAKEIYNMTSRAQNYLEQRTGNTLRIGISTSFSSVVIATIEQLRNIFPNLQLSINTGMSHEIVSQMLEAQHDVAFVVRIDLPPDKFRVINVSDAEKYVLVAGWTTHIGYIEPLQFSDLINHTFMIPRNGAAARDMLFSRFRAEGLEPKHVIFHNDQLQSYKSLVELGNTIGIMPEIEVREDVKNRRLRVLRMVKDMEVSVVALVSKELPEYEPAEKFISLVKAAFADIHRKVRTR